ncbi:hypothetical protein RJ639_032408 [Escallonia herrerae]|uniref:Uncharacterized protein n=1 Tax=Escallonia herrerae TaxID=1293975 RepID=A0AA88X7I7_9ASTE|nr:hypothetical protein RJ639_032408 [Escallonia herrerae]
MLVLLQEGSRLCSHMFRPLAMVIAVIVGTIFLVNWSPDNRLGILYRDVGESQREGHGGGDRLWIRIIN